MNPNPTIAEAHKARAVELRKQGRLDEALAELQQALRLRPNYPAAYFNIAAVRRDQGRTDEAVVMLRKAIELKPDYFQAYAAVGSALRQLGRLEEALAACKRAVSLKPDELGPRIDVAVTLHATGKLSEAAAEFEHVLKLDPRNPRAHNSFANLLMDMRQPALAVQHYRAALEFDPSNAEIHSNLGNVLRKQGKIDDAIASYKQTLAMKPGAWQVHSNLLLALNCHPKSDNGLLAEHLEWAKCHAEKFYPTQFSFPNDRSPDRRLRVGYVSPDFRRHSVAYFFEPILNGHNRSHVEVFCYSNVARPDETTAWMRTRADQWRDIAGLSDQRVAEKVRDDRIDILVDLAGHTGNNRLLLFARKPAPVQVTYLGYPNTTGLATMDYRLVDADTDPPGVADSHCSEKLVRLPRGFLCYSPHADSPDMRKHPRENSSCITFGSFNNFAKVTPRMIHLWSQILHAVPGSKLLIKADGLADQQTRHDTITAFISHGIAGERINLLGREPSFVKHLATYHQVDIGLDTFPYHGTTTTCEALWMGVPVITLAGNAHVSRVGVSLLMRTGLHQLIAASEEEYVATAVKLAGDPQKLQMLASGLRDSMKRSSLMDAGAFVRDLEAAYREMWRACLRA